VWFKMWRPRQGVIANANQVAGGGQPNPAAAARGAKAGMASRTNTLFSIPMLFFMAAASHFPSLTAALDASGGALGVYWVVALLVMAALEANALIGPGAKTQKMLTTVSGTIHGGLIASIVLFVAQSVLL